LEILVTWNLTSHFAVKLLRGCFFERAYNEFDAEDMTYHGKHFFLSQDLFWLWKLSIQKLSMFFLVL